MSKKPTSFALSDEAKELLKLLAEKNIRSQSTMLEVLIKEEAKKQGVKLPAKP